MRHENFTNKLNFYFVVINNILFYPIFLLTKLFFLFDYRVPNKNLVIILGPSHLGDALFITPTIKFIKEIKKESRIFVISSKAGKIALENNPNVSAIILFDAPWFRNQKSSILKKIAYLIKLIFILRNLKPEIAFNYYSTSYYYEHIASWLANIPLRIGFSHKGFGYLINIKPPYETGKNVIQEINDMARFWLNDYTFDNSLKPIFFTTIKDEQDAAKLLMNEGLKNANNIIGINIGAQHNFLWQNKNYINLCNQLNENYDIKILFLGTNEFELQVDEIRNKFNFNTYSLVGKTSVNVLVEILRKLKLLITIDTGIRHLANTVMCNSIILRHSADSSNYLGKYSETETLIIHHVSCSPCGKTECPLSEIACMEGISISDIINIINSKNLLSPIYPA